MHPTEPGRIDFYDAYPFLSENQMAETTRVWVSADFEHRTADRGRFRMGLWTQRTGFATRQNFGGAFETSQIDPNQAGLGDLYERTNGELAVGVQSSFKSAPLPVGAVGRVAVEPGIHVRAGSTEQSRSLR